MKRRKAEREKMRRGKAEKRKREKATGRRAHLNFFSSPFRLFTISPFGLLLVFAFCFLISCSPDKSAPIKADAAWGYCPVCRMKVQSSDEWASEIHYSDGTKLIFESPGDMLTFYTAPDKYKVTDAQKDRANITKIILKEYQTNLPVDGRQAKLVYKSKIEGPMGPDFMAFNSRADADSFIAANGGTIVGLNDVTPEMIRDFRKR